MVLWILYLALLAPQLFVNAPLSLCPLLHLRAGPSRRHLVPSSGLAPYSPVALAARPDVCGPMPRSGPTPTLFSGRCGFVPPPGLPLTRIPRDAGGSAPNFPLNDTRRPAVLAPVPTPTTPAASLVPTPTPTASAPAHALSSRPLTWT